MSVHRPPPYDSNEVERTRDIIRDSKELLREPRPDTFAGRKTREPPPSEDDDPMARPDIQKLINSELRPPK